MCCYVHNHWWNRSRFFENVNVPWKENYINAQTWKQQTKVRQCCRNYAAILRILPCIESTYLIGHVVELMNALKSKSGGIH